MIVGMKIPESAIKITFLRSPGPGGQNVNKVATAALLRFDVKAAQLPEPMRTRLAALAGSKMTDQDELVIKAYRFRTQARNKEDALQRLHELLERAAIAPKKRIKTKPSKAARQKRLEDKKQQSQRKALRGKKFSE